MTTCFSLRPARFPEVLPAALLAAPSPLKVSWVKVVGTDTEGSACWKEVAWPFVVLAAPDLALLPLAVRKLAILSVAACMHIVCH